MTDVATRRKQCIRAQTAFKNFFYRMLPDAVLQILRQIFVRYTNESNKNKNVKIYI